MRDILIVIDMQNDFIDGSLGTPEAQAIIGSVAARVEAYRKAGRRVLFTRDTHESNYLETFEGRHLPVPHCIRGTEGWQIAPALRPGDESCVVDKITFGCLEWQKLAGDARSFELCGVCTDICVISNALILRAMYPGCEITVDPACCAGVTPQLHEAALAVMRSCQIEVL
ncbi:MAG: cysteine hydrolase [Mailhella sp.]|nr:cysteine hydrolase [Mailhella sp.]